MFNGIAAGKFGDAPALLAMDQVVYRLGVFRPDPAKAAAVQLNPIPQNGEKSGFLEGLKVCKVERTARCRFR